MNTILSYIFAQPSYDLIQIALCILRISIGILTTKHGLPKMGGIEVWEHLGKTFMYPLHITFLPVMWGFLGGITEFFGGILLTLGLGTRIVSFCLIIMMIIATVWHIQRNDSYNIYSFPLSLIFVYLTFFLIGADQFSLDYYLVKY